MKTLISTHVHTTLDRTSYFPFYQYHYNDLESLSMSSIHQPINLHHNRHVTIKYTLRMFYNEGPYFCMNLCHN